MNWRTYNHLLDLPALAVRLFLLRHGHSRANESGIIVSDPGKGVPEFGLSPQGEEEVRSSITRARETGILDASALIFSSPFRRAGETALLAARLLGTGAVTYDDRLRERYFGDFEQTSAGNYAVVWKYDASDPGHGKYQVESTLRVLERMTALVAELAGKYPGRTVLLVTHGDPGQILECAFLKQSPRNHRRLDLLRTGELRELQTTIPFTGGSSRICFPGVG